jgi:hypothetical protein
MVFGVGLDFFFASVEAGPVLAVVRREERQRFPDSPDSEHGGAHRVDGSCPAVATMCPPAVVFTAAVSPIRGFPMASRLLYHGA